MKTLMLVLVLVVGAATSEPVPVTGRLQCRQECYKDYRYCQEQRCDDGDHACERQCLRERNQCFEECAE